MVAVHEMHGPMASSKPKSRSDDRPAQDKTGEPLGLTASNILRLQLRRFNSAQFLQSRSKLSETD